jgi:feruloyl esterase
MRYAVAKDTNFNPLTVNLSDPGPLATRLGYLSSIDRGDADLSQFAAKGGKLLIMHGTSDILVSPRETELYVSQLRKTMGSDKVDAFLRFYEVPAFGHALTATFGAVWDQLTAIEGWVEEGIDPAHNQVVTDVVGVPGRTRPLCLYPTWPKYKGAGDVNSAASFECVTH